jgi:hypothetical protein
MPRKLFTLAAGVSAVLCLASAVGWVDSCRTGRIVRWQGARPRDSAEARSVVATSFKGVTYFTGLRYSADARLPAGGQELRLGTLPFDKVAIPRDAWSRAGFQHRVVRLPDGAGQLFAVPYWFWVAAGAVLPSVWVIRRRRARGRRAAGCCPACGYDLRATPDRCPECGSVPAAKGAAA